MCLLLAMMVGARLSATTLVMNCLIAYDVNDYRFVFNPRMTRKVEEKIRTSLAQCLNLSNIDGDHALFTSDHFCQLLRAPSIQCPVFSVQLSIFPAAAAAIHFILRAGH